MSIEGMKRGHDNFIEGIAYQLIGIGLSALSSFLLFLLSIRDPPAEVGLTSVIYVILAMGVIFGVGGTTLMLWGIHVFMRESISGFVEANEEAKDEGVGEVRAD